MTGPRMARIEEGGRRGANHESHEWGNGEEEGLATEGTEGTEYTEGDGALGMTNDRMPNGGGDAWPPRVASCPCLLAPLPARPPTGGSAVAPCQAGPVRDPQVATGTTEADDHGYMHESTRDPGQLVWPVNEFPWLAYGVEPDEDPRQLV